jgi:hypothetical protein
MATIKELKANGAPRFKVPGKEEIYDAFDQFLAENFLGETVATIPPPPANGGEFAPQAVALYAIGNSSKGNAGLWKSGTGTSSKNWDLSFLQGILNQFSTLPAATRGKTVSEIKEQLEDFASKKFAKNPANARNCLLHLCNPDIYPPVHSFADKLAICKEQSRLLEDFKLSHRWDSGLLKLKVFRKDGYVAIQTDEQLCWIFDKLSVMHKIEDEEFEEFMKNYFTAPKKSTAKKK